MEGPEGRRLRRWGRRASLAAAFTWHAAAVVAGADGNDAFKNVRLVQTPHRFAVAQALSGAVRQLEHIECQALLDEFHDASGRPLRANLEPARFEAPEYLRGWVFFYDAPERACGNANLAVTRPGSRAIFVCGPRFARDLKRNSRHAEAILIHEMLHSLGLGENPPSSDHITARVEQRCRGRGPVRGAGVVARRQP
jgi:hypothetical protein